MFNIWEYHNCVCQHGVIETNFFVLSFSILFITVLLGRNEGMHNKTPCSRLLRMHLLLHCVDLSSKPHLLEACETPWKQRGLLMAFQFSRKVFGTLRGLASILKNLSCDEILCLHACSVHWEGTLLSQLLSIWICSDFISCAFKKVSRASLNTRSSRSFMCILYCWVHVPPVFIPSQTVPPTCERSICL